MIEVLDYPQHKLAKFISIVSLVLCAVSYVGTIVIGTSWFVTTDVLPFGNFLRLIIGTLLAFSGISIGTFWLAVYQWLRYLACIAEYSFKISSAINTN